MLTDQLADQLASMKKRSTSSASEFYQTFGTNLRQFFSLPYGFDILKFEETVLKTRDGESCKQCIQRQYGDKAAELIAQLIG